MHRLLSLLAGAAVAVGLAAAPAHAQFRIPRPTIPNIKPPVQNQQVPSNGFILTDPNQKPGNFRPGQNPTGTTTYGPGQVAVDTNPSSTTTLGNTAPGQTIVNNDPLRPAQAGTVSGLNLTQPNQPQPRLLSDVLKNKQPRGGSVESITPGTLHKNSNGTYSIQSQKLGNTAPGIPTGPGNVNIQTAPDGSTTVLPTGPSNVVNGPNGVSSPGSGNLAIDTGVRSSSPDGQPRPPAIQLPKRIFRR